MDALRKRFFRTCIECLDDFDAVFSECFGSKVVRSDVSLFVLVEVELSDFFRVKREKLREDKKPRVGRVHPQILPNRADAFQLLVAKIPLLDSL